MFGLLAVWMLNKTWLVANMASSKDNEWVMMTGWKMRMQLKMERWYSIEPMTQKWTQIGKGWLSNGNGEYINNENDNKFTNYNVKDYVDYTYLIYSKVPNKCHPKKDPQD
jgi:hypothetical protein